MSTYVVQTTVQPGVSVEVDEAEYEQLLRLGLVLDAPVSQQPSLIDQSFSGLLTDHASLSYAAAQQLAAGPASTTVAGTVELATTAETTAGTDAVRAVTPAGLATVAATLIPTSAKGTAGGVATLDSSGKVPTAQVPAVAISDFLGAVSSQAAMLALVGQRGDWCTRTDLSADWILIADDPTLLASWRQLTGTGTGSVTSVAGRTGAVTLASTDLTDSTTTGRSLVTAADAATARATTGSAAVAHTHPVGDLTATGTLDGTHFLAGDNTWKVPAGIAQTIASAPAGSVFRVLQNSNSTWPARPSTRTDISIMWITQVAGSAVPAVATTPGTTTDGTYPGDMVVGA